VSLGRLKPLCRVKVGGPTGARHKGSYGPHLPHFPDPRKFP
jgi:hypothetical protein